MIKTFKTLEICFKINWNTLKERVEGTGYALLTGISDQ